MLLRTVTQRAEKVTFGRFIHLFHIRVQFVQNKMAAAVVERVFITATSVLQPCRGNIVAAHPLHIYEAELTKIYLLANISDLTSFSVFSQLFNVH